MTLTGWAVTPMLDAIADSKRFPGVHALDRISLDSLPGEVRTAGGESGAGKSTLLMILPGGTRPTRGHSGWMAGS